MAYPQIWTGPWTGLWSLDAGLSPQKNTPESPYPATIFEKFVDKEGEMTFFFFFFFSLLMLAHVGE